MKKLSKRLTMIVAILLSLVLLTSSVVSTTLAKYVTSKSATTTATLDKFGVEITFDGGTATTKKGDTVIYEESITMHPGDSKTIIAKVKGKPTVDANITVNFEVDYDSSKYNISKSDFSFLGNTPSKTYFPIGFKLGTTDVVAPYVSGDNAADTKVSSTIEGKITEKLTGLEWTTANSASSADWNSDATGSDYTSSEKVISITFYWPEDYNTTKNDGTPYDEIGTWISKNKPTFKVTYAITVEQA